MTSPSQKWWRSEAFPGVLLLAAALGSFVLQNGPWSPDWTAFLKAPIKADLGVYQLDTYVRGFVKDGLMAVFFFYVGLELKRECIDGPFRNPREAALPALGAIGGMLAPAAIYLLIATHLHPQASDAFARGWAIPCATDIAFAVGVLSLLGARVPLGLRLFLLALAIADDLGAILVIALFYSAAPNWAALAVVGGVFAFGLGLNRFNVKAIWPYLIVFAVLWAALSKSGVSPTIAGVLAALTIPMTAPNGRKPLVEVEHTLQAPVQLAIMPLFALVMAGVPLAGVGLETLTHPTTAGVALGLVLGKPVGIVAFSLLGSALLRQALPASLNTMIGAGLVAGIGFTMSLFVGALAFYGAAEMEAPIRIGVLGGSIIAALAGLFVLHMTLPPTRGDALNKDLASSEETAERDGVLEPDDPTNTSVQAHRNG